MQKIDTPSAVFCLWNITTMPAGPPFFSTSLNTSDAFDDAQCTPAHTYPGAPPSSYFLLLLQQSKNYDFSFLYSRKMLPKYKNFIKKIKQKTGTTSQLNSFLCVANT